MKDLLKYYIALQSFFKEKLGDCKICERVYHKDFGFGWIIAPSHPSLLKIHFDTAEAFGQEWYDRNLPLLRIPTLEQLWEMVDGTKSICTYKNGESFVTLFDDDNKPYKEYCADTPAEAILKVLLFVQDFCEQEGVKV
jgi:hypothetical protein